MGNKAIPPIRERNLVLTGFMGVGKTVIGERVARKLYRDFIDIDAEIERTYNMKVSDIFSAYGEQTFRRTEREMIVELCHTSRLKVISLGGGAFMQQEVREACLGRCIVFLLDLSWESWKKRMDLLIDSRPVLKNRSMDEIEELYWTRKKMYELHHSEVKTDDLNPEEIADEIVESLKTGWEIYNS